MQNKATILQYTLFSCWFSQQMSYSNTLSFRPTKQNQANPLYTTFFIPLQQAPVLRKHMLIWAQQAKQKRLVPRKIVFLSVAPQPWNLGSPSRSCRFSTVGTSARSQPTLPIFVTAGSHFEDLPLPRGWKHGFLFRGLAGSRRLEPNLWKPGFPFTGTAGSLRLEPMFGTTASHFEELKVGLVLMRAVEF